MDESVSEAGSSVQFTFTWQDGRVADITTNSASINHFLDLLQLSRAYNTWVSYGQDLKVFFSVMQKPPEAVTRADCLAFMRNQDESGFADATINRRLAAVSSLFNELSLLDPSRFPSNPVQPSQRGRHQLRQPRQSLYRRQAQRIPDIVPVDELRTFLSTLPSWRDRSMVMQILVQEGMPEPAIRQMVGHRRPESLLPYLHLSDEFVEIEFQQAQKGFDLSTWLGDAHQGGGS